MKDDATGSETISETPLQIKSKVSSRRRKLMWVAPAVAVLAGVLYLFAGRYVSTDNAFVRADIADISPEVSGAIHNVMVKDNQFVKSGDPLVKIDSTNYDILLLAAETRLRQVTSDIDAERAQYRQHVEELRAAKSEMEFATRQFQRQSRLASSSAGAEAARDAAQNALAVAQAHVALSEAKIKESLSKLFGDPDIPIEQHPSYQQTLAQREVAALQVKRSTLVAPFDGIVSHVPQVGDYARTGATLISLVSVGNIWVEANYKETEITYMRPEQDAVVTVDAYPGQEWRAKIGSLAQATGSEFALLPAQNATGNWVKVVQRLPVRLKLELPKDGPVLRAGMSVEVTVDTGARRISRWLDAGG